MRFSRISDADSEFGDFSEQFAFDVIWVKTHDARYPPDFILRVTLLVSRGISNIAYAGEDYSNITLMRAAWKELREKSAPYPYLRTPIGGPRTLLEICPPSESPSIIGIADRQDGPSRHQSIQKLHVTESSNILFPRNST